MASKRKSTTPCMLRTPELTEQAVPEDGEAQKEKGTGTPQQDSKDGWAADTDSSVKECEVVDGKAPVENQSKKLQGGYECKYCPYSTQNLNEFTEHVDTQHPNVILNPLYVCAECNFTTKKYDSLSDHNTKYHPGENNFKLKLIKRNNQTVLEQSIETTNSVVTVTNSGLENAEFDETLHGEINVSKTLLMKQGKPKVETKKGPKKTEEGGMENHVDGTLPRVITETTESIACINGADLLHDVLAHVMPSVQLPPNINLVPKVPVPLNSTKYNCALDTNATMINSFNKFPYPTQAELSWLTAASKHPEEQIRIWFATQRLKHGISWSPEEVEEARKKMFNGTIQSVPQTITVLPAHLTPAKMPQPIIQTALPCQILGQTGLVLTQVSNGSTVSCSPITLAVAANQGQKRTMQTLSGAPEVKRPHVVHVPEVSPKLNAAPLTPTNDRKKTKEQIAELKASFIMSQFPDNAEIYRLIEVTGLSRSEIKKWFSDHRYRSQRGIVHITSESIAKDQLALAAVRHGRTYHTYADFTPHRFKEKTHTQLRILEESFLRSSFPTQGELDRLRVETKLSRREVDSWFSERRKLRDSMEQAVLDSMGSNKKNMDKGLHNGTVSQTELLSSSQLPSSLSGAESSAAFNKKNQEQIHLLKSTFARTQWPSPQEYDQLAAQTGLTRTDIVRWFKESRSSLRTGTLKWTDRYQQEYVVDGHNEQNQKNDSQQNESPKNCDQVSQHHKKLNEENVDKLFMRSTRDYEPPKDSFLGNQTEDRLECNSQDGHGSEENEDAGDVSWVEVTVEDDDAVSDCTDSWSQTAPEGQAELADFDSESVSGDNSHI
uniref:Zinc fingers and homeoboxes protein 2 n=1 Tax=Pelodiscus sinensis TaxID=13735 RepID=K7FK68_PELSI|nr:zinc fingers and homeoboxes protein 2 [Pelodiscus sinensis]XP_006137564.1 zinc fingers and homeoboxes protein 2 [Pelodiscus sinensis]XP_006137565.1 zinc fingers and homeoboxes protein 2 [Pelodiscus sinensis]XP_006137566.1 zinc fingers and homeoboxes protein 2 [Pelodiscus sinensis]|eukprot:XP_006137563.1 zinc fingers and homeoboxes protein 2 [Pelodiscus sinensis]